MKLFLQQFQEKYQNNKLAISLIGMSNIGKSYWSKQLACTDFVRILELYD